MAPANGLLLCVLDDCLQVPTEAEKSWSAMEDMDSGVRTILSSGDAF